MKDKRNAAGLFRSGLHPSSRWNGFSIVHLGVLQKSLTYYFDVGATPSSDPSYILSGDVSDTES